VAGWSDSPLTIVARSAAVADLEPELPGPTAPEVQVFGRLDSRPTQKALRFFRERRIKVSFVNLAQRPLAPAELRRFIDRFGAHALLDPDSRAYREQGLAYLALDPEGVSRRLIEDSTLIRLPLARSGNRLSVGPDERAWRALLEPEGG
jgi:arsenate reductase-like glutaredoxin family protein